MARNYLQFKIQGIMVGFKRQQEHLSKQSEGEAVNSETGKVLSRWRKGPVDWIWGQEKTRNQGDLNVLFLCNYNNGISIYFEKGENEKRENYKEDIGTYRDHWF